MDWGFYIKLLAQCNERRASLMGMFEVHVSGLQSRTGKTTEAGREGVDRDEKR